MSQLFESIRVENGRYENLFYHEQRMMRSAKALFGDDEPLDLEEYLKRFPPPEAGVHKCKLIYDANSRQVGFTEYKPRVIESLKVVEHDRINYEFKYVDRKNLDHLYSFRDGCDDILIIKRGVVTDSSFANLAFRRGKEWFTPWQPLLKGTMRQQLLEYDKIREEEILKKEIKEFDAIKLINAMIRFDSPEIAIDRIVF